MTTLNAQLNSNADRSNFIAEVRDSHIAFVIVGPRILDSGHGSSMTARGTRIGTKYPGQYRQRFAFSQANVAFVPFNKVA